MPKQIKLSNIENYLYLFNDNNNVIDDIKWLEPIFVTMVSAYNEDVGFAIETDNIYLTNMLNLAYRENSTYSPVEKIHTRGGLEKISTQLTTIMMQNFTELSDSDAIDLKQYLQYLFLELMNNVADHSQSIGHVMTQYYPTSKTVQFAISDRGVGFLSNLQLKFPELSTEEEAIFKALEKGVTATPQKMYGQEKNAGYGLYAMVEILKQTNGQFVIISNDTMVRYQNNLYAICKLQYKWTGVVVAFRFDEAEINFSMDHFKKNYLWNDLEDEEDFF
jgi:hypothetical protein